MNLYTLYARSGGNKCAEVLGNTVHNRPHKDHESRVWEPHIKNPGIMDVLIPICLVVFLAVLYGVAYDAGLTVFPR